MQAGVAAAALTGTLFRFKHPSWPAPLQAFESPHGHAHDRFAIYVGGLTDGLLACSYVERLGAELDSRGWSLVQPVLSSAYTGYGTSSLERDAEQLSELCAHLDSTRSVRALAIIGHSTGCQDAVTLLAQAPPKIRCLLRAAILQAPVSDREAASLEGDEKERAALVEEAKALVGAGRGEALLSRLHYDFVPMSASRWLSLCSRLGSDDMFSSDLTDEELQAVLGHMGTAGQRMGRPAQLGRPAVPPAPLHPGLHTVFVHSGADEYVPPDVDVGALSRRMVAAAGGAEQGAASHILSDANHNCATPPTAAAEFTRLVGEVLGGIKIDP